jgi:hypothetical protein
MSTVPLPEAPAARLQRLRDHQLPVVEHEFQAARDSLQTALATTSQLLGEIERDLDALRSSPESAEASVLVQEYEDIQTFLLGVISTLAPDEAHLWTPEFQAMVRENAVAIAEGRTDIFLNDESFEAALAAHCATTASTHFE